MELFALFFRRRLVRFWDGCQEGIFPSVSGFAEELQCSFKDEYCGREKALTVRVHTVVF